MIGAFCMLPPRFRQSSYFGLGSVVVKRAGSAFGGRWAGEGGKEVCGLSCTAISASRAKVQATRQEKQTRVLYSYKPTYFLLNKDKQVAAHSWEE